MAWVRRCCHFDAWQGNIYASNLLIEVGEQQIAHVDKDSQKSEEHDCQPSLQELSASQPGSNHESPNIVWGACLLPLDEAQPFGYTKHQALGANLTRPQTVNVQVIHMSCQRGRSFTSASSLIDVKREGEGLGLLTFCSASVSSSYAFLLGLVERPLPLMVLLNPTPPDFLFGSAASPGPAVASRGWSGSSSYAFLLGRVARPLPLIALRRPPKLGFLGSSLILCMPRHDDMRQKCHWQLRCANDVGQYRRTIMLQSHCINMNRRGRRFRTPLVRKGHGMAWLADGHARTCVARKGFELCIAALCGQSSLIVLETQNDSCLHTMPCCCRYARLFVGAKATCSFDFAA